MEKKITVENGVSERADVYLARETGLTRSRIKSLCDDGFVKINGKPIRGNKAVHGGEEIEYIIPEVKKVDLQPLAIPLDVVYQDSDVAVINKPQGLTVHAGNGTKGDTLVNALLYNLDNLSGINGELRPGIVHRIDKNTSGLMVVAKNDNAHLILSNELKDKSCHRVYVALLEGIVKDDGGRIETFIGRDKNNRTKMAVVKSGRIAVTDYKVLERYAKYTLCEFTLHTGRTHQIRVHAKYIGHPIVGDKEYGYKNQRFNLNGQLLHAKTLEFIHPTTGKKVSFNAPLPDYFEEIINKVKGE